MNASGAVRTDHNEIIAKYADDSENLIAYEDNVAGCCYLFEKKTGSLVGIRLNAEKVKSMRQSIADSEPKDSTQLLIQAEEFVKARNNKNYILTDTRSSGTVYRYTFEEQVQGIPSGAKAILTLYSDGTIFSYSFTPAESNRQISDDSFEVAKEAVMLTQEEAQKIALQLGVEYATENGELPVSLGECKLVVYCGKPCYEVKLNATCNCGIDHYRVYTAYVDLYTGQTDGISISK